MIIYNNSVGCINGYIGLTEQKHIDNCNSIKSADITFEKLSAYTGYNNVNNNDMYWIGFDTLHHGDEINLDMSKKYDTLKEYIEYVKKVEIHTYKHYKTPGKHYVYLKIIDVIAELMNM